MFVVLRQLFSCQEPGLMLLLQGSGPVTSWWHSQWANWQQLTIPDCVHSNFVYFEIFKLFNGLITSSPLYFHKSRVTNRACFRKIIPPNRSDLLQYKCEILHLGKNKNRLFQFRIFRWLLRCENIGSEKTFCIVYHQPCQWVLHITYNKYGQIIYKIQLHLYT